MTVLARDDARQFSVPAWSRLALAPTLTAIGILVLLFHRNSTLFLHPQMWAEDLLIYFVDDRLWGAKAILLPYSGYVQLACRLVGYLAGFFPDLYAPHVYAVSFLGSIFLTAALTYTSPAFSGLGKPLATLTLIAAPVASEIFFGMCYIHWVMAPLVGLALYERNIPPARAVVMVLCFAVVGLSSPFTVIAMPLVLVKLVSERSRYAIAIAAIGALCVAFHFTDMLGRAGIATSGNSLDRIAVSLTIFYRWYLGGGGVVSQTTMLLVSMITASLVFYYFVATFALEWRAKIYLVGYGVAMLIVGCASTNLPDVPNQFGPYGRYFYTPLVMFIWTFILIEQRFPRRAFSLPAAAVLLGSIYVAHANRNSVQYTDDHWPQVVECLKTQDRCGMDINPTFLGKRMIPTDLQLKSWSTADRHNFSNKP